MYFNSIQIPLGGLVCYACWQSAHRSVQRAANVDAIRQDQPLTHRKSICAWCRMSLHRRQTHILPRNGPIRDEVAARIYPYEVSYLIILFILGLCDKFCYLISTTVYF